MCSFLFYCLTNHVSIKMLKDALKFMQKRGPDGTFINKNKYKDKHILCLHNLLHICGALPKVQPIIEDGIICIFNGEIYNYKSFLSDSKSDTECIIPLYKKHGIKFAQYLDGEFAIVLYDTINELLIWSTDVFMTKPLYIGYTGDNGEIGIASYASALNSCGIHDVKMANPNETVCVKLDNPKVIIQSCPVYQFDLHKVKHDLGDWIQAFDNAVRKRVMHGCAKVFVTLSSGYDSGCITASLNKQNIKYDSFSISKGENKDILDRRMIINRTTGSCDLCALIEGISIGDKQEIVKEINENSEPFKYVHEDSPGNFMEMKNDNGAAAMYYICKVQRERKYKVIISGTGADEIISDYGFNGSKIYYHSEFGGKWPQDMNTIFPWKKFYDDTQRSYLFKDEFIGGTHGMECRYPFLDKYVVQEYIWLSSDLKNKAYKYPLFEYLKKEHYPMCEGQKLGFCI